MAVNLTGIDLRGAATGSARKTAPVQNATLSSQDAAAQQPQSDVQITSTATLLARLEQTLSAQPAIDQKRVDAVSKSLAAGTYRIQPDKIASELLQSERSLAPLPLRGI